MSADDFWRFSLDVYGRPGIEPLCLELQERHGVDVNLVLLAGWLGGQGIELSAARVRALEAAARPWRERSVLPLRALRRSLRACLEPPEPAAGRAVRDEVVRLRERIKQAELDAERIEQRLLVAVAAKWPSTAPAGARLIATNLRRVHDFRGEPDALQALVGALRR